MKNKSIWMMNHYATNSYFNKGGRHYWFAENLIKQGYKPTVFCANTRHNSDDIIEIADKKYIVKIAEGIPYVFIKTVSYKGNGLQRLKNMMFFYKNLFPVAKKYAKKHGKPDIILASSVHPLTLVAGIKIAKKFRVPCICEIRDLWPESLVEYNIIKKSNPLLKLLYAGEKWIYTKADKLIFTMEGGKDYIIEKKWNTENGGPIDLSKVFHINNGVDLETFNYNKSQYTIDDEDINDDSCYKIIYTGSLRKANRHIWKLINTAILMKSKGYKNIKLLIYGEGGERRKIEEFCEANRLDNIYIKGFIEKKYIPYVLTCCNLNILNCSNKEILKYGGSQNKLFDYLASGNPIITGEDTKYSIIKNTKCGIAKNFKNEEELMEAILEIKNMDPSKKNVMRKNILKTAQEYDYKNLTQKLIKIIEG